MHIKDYIVQTVLILIVYSCDEEKKNIGVIADDNLNSSAEKLVFGNKGVKVDSNVYILNDEQVTMEKMPIPEVFPINSQPLIVPAYDKQRKVGTPKINSIPKKLNVIEPGKDSIPFPKKYKLRKGVSKLALQPENTPALYPQMKDNAKYNIQNMDVFQGLNSSSIFDIKEDKFGRIWLGTGYGLTRYDGQSFNHYTIYHGLAFNAIYQILIDSKGDIWCTNSFFGFCHFDGQEFTQYTTESGLSGMRVYPMFEDSQGKLWFGTLGNGVNMILGDTITYYTSKEGLIDNNINEISEDEEGNIWFATESGVSRFDGLTFTNYSTEDGLPNNNVKAIEVDKNGHLWFGTRKGISRFDGLSFTNYSVNEGLIDNFVWEITKDKKGNIWIGTFKGLACFDGHNFTGFTTEEGLSSNKIYCIYEDGSENLWIGTDKGVGRFDPNSFVHFRNNKELNGIGVSSIYEDTKQNIWIGTGEGLTKFDGRDFYQFPAIEEMENRGIYSILEDQRNDLWLGTQQGACRFDGSNLFQYTFTEESNDDFIFSLEEDNKGGIWFGTTGGKWNRFDGANLTQFNFDKIVPFKDLHAIQEDAKGDMWFGYLKGLFRFDGSNLIQYFTTSDNWIKTLDCVFTICEDSEGHIWIGGFNGSLSYFNGSDFAHSTIGLIDEQTNNRVLSIIEDRKKNIWCSSLQGITLLTPQLENFPSEKTSNINDYKITNFSINDGLYRLDYKYNSACLDSKNRLWWGSVDGLTMLDLNKFSLTGTPAKIGLNSIDINRKFIDYRRLKDSIYINQFEFGELVLESFDSVVPFFNYPSNITLPYKLNHLTFYFSAIDWNAPHKIKYSYMMDGLEEGWSPFKSESKAEYRNIPFGNYTFKVKAIGIAQEESEVFEYKFSILPPWYRTWWAYTLWVALILGSIYWLYQFQLNRQLAEAEAQRLKELDDAKNVLYTNITHEFRTPLTVILGMVDQMKADPKNWFSEGATLIRRNGKLLLNLVNQMLDLSKLESGNMPLHLVQGDVVGYLKYLSESFHSYADSKDIRLHFRSDFPELVMDHDPEKLQNIVSNLLSNAIKFTPAGGDVYLDLRGTGNEKNGEGPTELLLRVSDNGPGIAPEHLPHIFDRFYQANSTHTRRGEGTGIGLALTRELVQVLGGSIQVESELGAGAHFKIWLPIRREAKIVSENTSSTTTAFLSETIITDAIQSQSLLLPEQNDRDTVLLVEDNPDVLTYLSAILSTRYQVLSANDGQSGIDTAKEVIPDLIVSDVMMPKKDGFELCEALKSDERTSHIPIVLLTAKADQRSKIEGLSHRADAYLTKPFHQEELLVRLEKLIELRKSLQRHYQQQGVLRGVLTQKTIGQEDAFLKRVVEAIEAEMADENFGMPQLCKALRMTRSTLFRKLKALTGKSTSNLIRTVRLERAKELLENTDKTVSEVCYEVGVNNPSYFSTVFKEEFGIAPSEVRKGSQEG